MSESVGLPRVKKLTSWKKEPSVLDLKKDLEASKPAHNAHNLNVQRWLALRNGRGKTRQKPAPNRSQVQPKLIRRQNEWRYSALSEPFLSSDKLFDVEPHTFEDGPSAEQNELVLNWQFRTKIDKVRFIDEYVRTAVDEGTVIVRTGWFRSTRKTEVEVPVFAHRPITTQEEAQQLEQALMLREANPNGYQDLPEELRAAADYFLESQIPTVAVITRYETEEQDEVVENRPTVEFIDPENIYIDPSCGNDLNNAGFVVVSFETSRAELLKDGRYKNLDAVNWSGNEVLSEPDHATQTPTDFNYEDKLRKRVVAYEYWGLCDIDGSEELKPIVATWIGDIMIRCELNPFPDQKPPFVVVPYLPVRRQLTGEPDAEILEDNQSIVGALMRGMIDLLGRSANSQQAMPKGWVDAVNRRRLEKGQDYEYNPGQYHPEQAVYQHKYPEIPTSALTMLNLQNHEAESLSGVKAFHGGMSGEAYGEVAAGIKGMLDAAAKREMNILRRLAKGIQAIGVKLAAMNAVFLSEKEVVRVTNETFVPVRREDLAGNFDLIVDIATAEVDATKAQDLGFMLQTMGPNMSFEISKRILAKIAKLKRMPDLAHELMTFKPEPDPLQEAELKLKQLEIQKVQKEIEEIDSKVTKNRASAAKDMSEADLNDLEYLEEESGTKHARDMEKQGAQAQANQDLEITKSLVKERKPETKAPDIEAAIGYKALTDPTPFVGQV